MTSKIIVNTIEADTGISSVTFASNINLQNDSSVLVSSSGVTLGTGSTIAAPSANEITLSTNSAERLRLTSGGQVRIGNSTITASSSADDLIIGLDSPGGDRGVTIISGTSGTGNIFFSDTNTSGVGNRMGTITYDHSGNFMRFSTAGNNERLRITSGGNLQVKGGNLHLDSNAELALFEDNTSGTYTNSAKIAFDFSGNVARMRSSTNGSATIKPLAFYIANTPAIFIGTDGKVGINQITPDKLLHISSSSDPTIRIENTSTGAQVGNLVGSLEFEGQDNNAAGVRAKIDAEYRGVGAATAIKIHTAWENETTLYESAYFTKPTIKFTTNNVERLRITSAGRMGLGTNDPNALLEVRDSENTTQGNAQIRISKGVGSGAAPATITRANTYLHLGGTEWGSGANGKYLIGLGYTNDEVGTGIPAYMGYTETSVGGYTQGDLIFGTRDNTTGTNNPTERLRIDSNGIITKPYQPSFYVGGNFSLTSWNSNKHANWVDATTAPLFDTNNDYTNGVFTAPVDGKYYFSASFLTGSGAGFLLWAFYKNTSKYQSGWFQVYDDSIDSNNECQLTGSVIMDMSAGDTARVAINNTHDNVYTTSYNYFLGYLIG